MGKIEGDEPTHPLFAGEITAAEGLGDSLERQ
jgi:hypothetical protein